MCHYSRYYNSYCDWSKCFAPVCVTDCDHAQGYNICNETVGKIRKSEQGHTQRQGHEYLLNTSP